MVDKALEYIAAEYQNEPKYVQMQMDAYKSIASGEDAEWMVSDAIIRRIYQILQLIRMPSGMAAGQTLYECLSGYQWLVIFGALAVVSRSDGKTRKHQVVLLEIGRKNGKTLLIAIIFLILFLIEPQFSQFFSVAPDGALSRLVMGELKKLIAYNSDVLKISGSQAFKVMRDEIRFGPKDSTYIPLNYANGRLDGRLPSVWLCDEAGALPDNYAIEAMQSGQITVANKLGFIISTKYPKANNPFDDWIERAKKMLQGLSGESSLFALLYEPDEPKAWETDDNVLRQANPFARTEPMVWDDLLKKRATAIAYPATRSNFLLKHCNIAYSGIDTESYVDIGRLQTCKVDEPIDLTGKVVWLGVDMAMSNDNCAVMWCFTEDDTLKFGGMVFYPEALTQEKTVRERVPYDQYAKRGFATPCGDRTVAYGVIEDYVLTFEERTGATVAGVGFDRYNCLSSAQKWDDAGMLCVDIKQHSSVLHPATKYLYEQVENEQVAFADNPLILENFANARCQYDTNLNRYMSKKKSNGKVDMVAALLNAVHLMMQSDYYDDGIGMIVL